MSDVRKKVTVPMERTVHFIGKEVLAPLCRRPRWRQFPQLTDQKELVTCGTCLQILKKAQ